MNRGLRLIAGVVGLCAVALVACGKEQLTRRAPDLKVTIFTEGQNYATFSDETLTIDLGQVPTYSTAYAVYKLENPTSLPLNISSVTYTSSSGERWLDADFPTKVNPFGEEILRIGYSPMSEGTADFVVAEITSDSANARVTVVTVKGTGVFVGAPSIQVEYPGYTGPADGDCVDVDADGNNDGCVIPVANGLDMGNIGLSAQGSARLILKNIAECAPYPGADPCSSCTLRIAKGTRDIGLGFAPGTNDDARFSFAGSTATPFDVRQRGVECGESGQIRLLINFQAPDTEGDFQTRIIVESNDPARPVVEIPVIAHSRNAPVAIARFKPFDPANPTQYTDPTHVEPLTRVYFDGSQSYDPRNPTDRSLISGYRWEVVEAPAGVNVGDYQMQFQNSDKFSFWLPLAGHYVVKLTVTNIDGIESGDTADSRVEFDVVPTARMHIQLTWDNPTNDQDLHLVYASRQDELCGDNDCHWQNCNPADSNLPQWFNTSPAGSGPNPTLDIDDTNGLGPENINIKNPSPATFRVYVHNWRNDASSDTQPTRNTVRIFLDGVQVAEYRRTIKEEQLWAVADITWTATGGIVNPYASDRPGEVGTVRSFTRSDCSGGDIW